MTMFDRFDDAARATVVAAAELCTDLGDRFLGSEHLLVAVLRAGDTTSVTLGRAGVTPERVLAAVTRHGARMSGGWGRIDAEALAAIGIDLDEVRAAVS